MKHIICNVDENLHRNRQFDTYFQGRRIGVLDIETTGLDRRRTSFILGGLLDVQSGELHQIFAEDLSEEKEALRAFAELVSPMEVVITYNGRNFDMPFLKERAKRHGVHVPDPYDLDIYRMIRRNSPLKRLLPNLRQKTVEEYMGLWQTRDDEISGAESVELYFDYIRTGDPVMEEKILLHNSDDVCQLTRLTKVISKCDFHQSMYDQGFPAGDPARGIVVTEIKQNDHNLIIAGEQRRDHAQFRCFEVDGYPADIAFTEDPGTFTVKLPLVETEGIKAFDLRAAGLDETEFDGYPVSGSGFIALSDGDGIKHRECNHVVRAFMDKITEMVYYGMR